MEEMKMGDFVTSDWHFCHANILKYENSEERFHGNIDERDRLIIDNANSIIAPDDTIYMLGDVYLGVPRSDIRRVSLLIHEIHGRKILILGNHDRHRKDVFERLGFDEIHEGPIYYPNGRNDIILSHEPAKEAFGSKAVINIHGHVHNGKLDIWNFWNVNVDNTNYMPEPMGKFENIAKAYCRENNIPPMELREYEDPENGIAWYNDHLEYVEWYQKRLEEKKSGKKD
jgi:calcineurin-like phosphoesterase family protein